MTLALRETQERDGPGYFFKVISVLYFACGLQAHTDHTVGKQLTPPWCFYRSSYEPKMSPECLLSKLVSQRLPKDNETMKLMAQGV